MNATEKQVSGSHYKNHEIQPVEFSTKNGLSFCEGNLVKYVLRHEHKNGAEDIDKAIHYLELEMFLNYDPRTGKYTGLRMSFPTISPAIFAQKNLLPFIEGRIIELVVMAMFERGAADLKAAIRLLNELKSITYPD